MKDLLIRTITGITLVVLVTGSILLGPVPLLLLVIAIYLLAISELVNLQSPVSRTASIIVALAGSVLLLIIYLVIQYQLHPLWFLLPAAIWLAGFLAACTPGFCLLALCWITLPLALFYVLGWLGEDSTYDPLLPLSVIALVWINDTFAYLTGTWIGKHQMTPVRSPGKTWEGFVGGLVFTMMGGWLTHLITGTYQLPLWFLFSLIVTSFGLWGDLFESRLKRERDLKNTGRLLPGHGGILDRFDSLFFVTPAVFMVILFIRFFSG